MSQSKGSSIKRNSPPPIVFILAFLAFLGGSYWFISHQKSDSWQQHNNAQLSNSVNNSTGTERMSIGNGLLISADASSEKKAGIQAFSQGNFALAVNQFKASLQKRKNDPETLIYLNNAQIGNKPAYKIAVSVPIGSNLNVAQEILRGVAQAQEQINQNGGINGTPLLVEIANDENNPEIAKEIATKLVQDSNVLAVIGHNASDASLEAAPIYQKSQLVAITPTSSAQNLTEIGDYIFRAVPNNRLVAERLARQIVKSDRKTKILVCSDGKASEKIYFQKMFISAIEAEGSQVVDTVCDFAAPNFNANAIVSAAVANGAEGILLNPHIDRFDPSIAIIKANKGRLTLYGTSTLYTFKTLQEGQENVNGMVLAVPWHPDSSVDNSFAANAQNYWGGTVNWRTAMAYDATQAIIAGLHQSNTREGLKQALHNPELNAQGASEIVKFSPSGERLGDSTLVQVQPRSSGYEFVSLQQ
ncbi:ABC transporter substrate-binding protein [Planktothrix pseudagardhii]|uniref:Leucine-, isoleucine-, valine-, threonine-, and alanine-binding protein n=1 Tax=Planktothrix pseudagardhii TaxID=132604 RepID=A0A9W4GAL7_9CYAN|nr:ABC transporter substrate-binding protein [Planktothrix pseudagardhii]CAD5988666.1 Leucine-, isoleucine-, valine-, threonine-, and alanine-binding protein [Planktothrix pseudagardhii]